MDECHIGLTSESVAKLQDNLEPGLRISTQRRLTSLEADLARAEQRDVAKKNGGKYHMIKFFGTSISVHVHSAVLVVLQLIF